MPWVVPVCKADDRQDGVTLHPAQGAPGHLTAYCVRETAIEVVSRFFIWRCGMKLYILFALIDLMILLAYPFVFIASKLRQLFSFKR